MHPKLVEAEMWPAIDLRRTFARRPDFLSDAEAASRVDDERRALSDDPREALTAALGRLPAVGKVEVLDTEGTREQKGLSA